MADQLETEVVITAKDQASAVANKVAAGFQKVGTAFTFAESKIKGYAKSAVIAAAGGVGLTLGFRAIASSVYQANVELGRTQKQLTGVLFGFQNWNKALSPIQRVKIAQKEMIPILKDLEAAEMRLAMPVEELAAVYKTVAGPAFSRLGLSQKQTTDLTIRAAESAKVLGVSSQQAATTMTRALTTGKVSLRSVDPFSLKLKEILGQTKGLSSAQLYARMNDGLKSLAPAAEELSQGLDDVSFRIKDVFQDTLRDVAGPSVQYVGGLMKRMSVYMNETVNGTTRFEQIGQGVLTVFKGVASTTEFIFNHWKKIAAVVVGAKLLSIGKSVLGGGGIAGALGGATTSTAVMNVNAAVVNMNSAAGPIADAVKTTLGGKAAAVLGGLKSKLLSAGGMLARGGLVGGAAAVGAAAGLTTGTLALALGRSIGEAFQGKGFHFFNNARDAAVELKESAQFLGGDVLNRFSSAVTGGAEKLEEAGRVLAMGVPFRTGSAPFSMFPQTYRPTEKDLHPTTKAPVQNFTGDIHITQEFKEQDPDRVFIRFKEDLEALGTAPVSDTGGGPTSRRG